MSDVPIVAIELHHVALPTRREHKWTGLTEPIGGYALVKMIDAAGAVGWGEAPALKDWGGEFGRYFGESPATTIEVITRYLAPAVKGCMPGEIGELHTRMDRSIKGYPMPRRRWNSRPMTLPADNGGCRCIASSAARCGDAFPSPIRLG